MRNYGKVLQPISTGNLFHPPGENEYLENRGNHLEKMSYFLDMYFRNWFPFTLTQNVNCEN